MARRRAVVLAAHPDDETIGAGDLLRRLRAGVVVLLTDGAPREARYRPPALDRAAYARLRRRELERALGLAGVTGDRVLSLGAVDQEAARMLPELARALAALLARLRPALLVTHPYEGGHPDHDAAALVGRAAAALVRAGGGRPPRLVEMTSYHAGAGGLVTGRFLAAPDARDRTRALAPSARELKRAMLACFESQRAVLAPFEADLARERFRIAPPARFDAPPHAGPLWYERLGFALTGARWRLLARAALRALRLPEVLA